MRCYYCESEIPETAQICPVCGGKQIDYEHVPQPEEMQPEEIQTEEIQPEEAQPDIQTEQTNNAAESEETQPQKAIKYKPSKSVIITAAALFITALSAVIFLYIIPNAAYNEAVSTLESGDFETAKGMFTDIGTFRDAGEMISQSDYRHAHALLDAGDFDSAINMFSQLQSYEDSQEMLVESFYRKAQHLLENNQYSEAAQILSDIHPYKDSQELINEAAMQQARYYISKKDFLHASRILTQIHPYGDSEELLRECDYLYAQHMIITGRLDEAREFLESMPQYSGLPGLIEEIDYIIAVTLKDDNQLIDALEAFKNLETYKDSEQQHASVIELIYQSGAESYRSGNYRASVSWFDYTQGYADTEKYLLLMDARSDETAENGMALLGILGFEDAASIITDSDYYLRCFLGQDTGWDLSGYWFNDYGSFILYHNRYPWFESDYLPYPDEDTFYFYAIEDGMHYQYARRSDDKDNWIPFWEYTVISQDEISVHNMYDNHRYTLFRKEGTLPEIRAGVKEAMGNSGSQTKGTMAQYGALDLAYPVAERYTLIGSPFGLRLGDDFHGGIDMTVEIGTPIYALGDGIVSGVYTQFSTGGGAGYYMTIELDTVDPKSGYPLRVTYMHMEKPTHLKEGERVERGQHIGYSGNTGYTYNTRNPDGTIRQYAGHLHVQISNNGTDGSKTPSVMVNPAWFYPDVEFRDGTHRRMSRERFLEVLYADYTRSYPNRVSPGQ